MEKTDFIEQLKKSEVRYFPYEGNIMTKQQVIQQFEIHHDNAKRQDLTIFDGRFSLKNKEKARIKQEFYNSQAYLWMRLYFHFKESEEN